MKPVHLTFLNALDVERLAITDEEILAAVEAGLLAQGRGETVIEPRVHLVPDPAFRGHFNVLRGYVAPLGRAGVKIVGDYVDNYKLGLPSEMALLNLFDPRTGMPQAILDATAITEMRTGAMTALGAKYLARRKPGCSAISARAAPPIGTCACSTAVRIRRRSAFIRAGRRAARLSPRASPAISASRSGRSRRWGECVRGADIVVEASRLEEPEPLLKTEWIKRSAFVVPYGTMSAVELSLTDIMDKIVVDDWGQCRQGQFGSLRAHVEAGRLSEATLHAELARSSPAASPDARATTETILFWHRGLSLSDIALGHAMLEKARQLGIGTRTPICLSWKRRRGGGQASQGFTAHISISSR